MMDVRFVRSEEDDDDDYVGDDDGVEGRRQALLTVASVGAPYQKNARRQKRQRRNRKKSGATSSAAPPPPGDVDDSESSLVGVWTLPVTVVAAANGGVSEETSIGECRERIFLRLRSKPVALTAQRVLDSKRDTGQPISRRFLDLLELRESLFVDDDSRRHHKRRKTEAEKLVIDSFPPSHHAPLPPPPPTTTVVADIMQNASLIPVGDDTQPPGSGTARAAESIGVTYRRPRVVKAVNTPRLSIASSRSGGGEQQCDASRAEEGSSRRKGRDEKGPAATSSKKGNKMNLEGLSLRLARAHRRRKKRYIEAKLVKEKMKRKEQATVRWQEECLKREKQVQRLLKALESYDVKSLIHDPVSNESSSADSSSGTAEKKKHAEGLSNFQALKLMHKATGLVHFYKLLNSLPFRPHHMRDVAAEASTSIIPSVSCDTLLKWDREFREAGNHLLPSMKGRGVRSWILSNEDLKQRAMQFIIENASPVGKPNMTIRQFQSFLNTELLGPLPPAQITPLTLPLSVATARTWMIKLGVKFGNISKGVYIDGHDREDVQTYRKDWLQRKAAREKHYPHYIYLNEDEALSIGISRSELSDVRAAHQGRTFASNGHEVFEFHVDDDRFDLTKFRKKLELGGEFSRVVDFSDPRNKRILLFVQDESIYRAYDAQKRMWKVPNHTILRKKGEGPGIMISGFACEHAGFLRLTREEVDEINRIRKGKGNCACWSLY